METWGHSILRPGRPDYPRNKIKAWGLEGSTQPVKLPSQGSFYSIMILYVMPDQHESSPVDSMWQSGIPVTNTQSSLFPSLALFTLSHVSISVYCRGDLQGKEHSFSTAHNCPAVSEQELCKFNPSFLILTAGTKGCTVSPSFLYEDHTRAAIGVLARAWRPQQSTSFIAASFSVIHQQISQQLKAKTWIYNDFRS